LTVLCPSTVEAIKSIFGVFFIVRVAMIPRLDNSAATKYSPAAPIMFLGILFVETFTLGALSK
jgi:hypothetical protein